MDSIIKRYGLANFNDFSITGFLVPTGHYAQEIGLIDLFKEHLKIDMKTVHHTPVDKIIELFVSMIAGCPDVKTINNYLVPDRLAAAAWCQKQFADQSQVSEVIHRITPENLLQLEEIFHSLFSQRSLARRHPVNEWLVVDVDMTGLPVSPTSKTYEGAAFGFMQEETGKGYKLTCAYTGGELGEVLGGLFDSGTAHCATKLIDLLLLIEKRVGSPPYSLHRYRASAEQLLTEAQKLEGRSQCRRGAAHGARKSQRQAVLERRAHKLDTRAQLLREKVADSLQIADSFDTLRSSNPYRAILIRGDAGFGSLDNIMQSLPIQDEPEKLRQLVYDWYMRLIMNDTQLQTIEQVKQFVEGSESLEFRGLGTEEKYEWAETVLVRFRYLQLRRDEKGVIRRYIGKVTGHSRAQVSRLIRDYKRTGRLKKTEYSRHRFLRKYTPSDVKLLAWTGSASVAPRP
ncbi:MAG: hypothetical protein DDT20_00355 [Firmicutes bacterium]|nr:hypothetical protein [Bacillota bacterium]